jgi:hypothetical protein
LEGKEKRGRRGKGGGKERGRRGGYVSERH